MAPAVRVRLVAVGVVAVVSAGGLAACGSKRAPAVAVGTTSAAPTALDHNGSRTPYSVTIGSGRAAVLHDGTSYAGNWKRAGQTSITSWDASGGGALTLAPGRTWVILVPAGTSVVCG